MSRIATNAVEWFDRTPLGLGAERVLTLGCEGNAATVADVMGRPFFLFGVYVSHAMKLQLQVSTEPSFISTPTANYSVLFQHDFAGAAYECTYDLTGIFANNNGWITLTQPYLRLWIQDSAGSAHTAMRFYAKAWGQQ